MYAEAISAALSGLEAFLVRVEASHEIGLGGFSIVGLPDAMVQEASKRVRSAIRNSGFQFPAGTLTVNLSPAGRKKYGTHFDLPMSLAILGATGQVNAGRLANFAVFGELSLDGEVKKPSGILPLVAGVVKRGIKNVIVPRGAVWEAAIVDGASIYPVGTLAEAVSLVNGEGDIAPIEGGKLKTKDEFPNYGVDFSDVKGQEHVKRAIEVAVAGWHNILMVGPPGTGKTMLARRIPTILPPMSFEEILEVTSIYSVCGLLRDGEVMDRRPFRSPHHTVSYAGMIGGGAGVPMPGEVSLAHRGVLFLDELTEFRRDVLEALRQPLQDGEVTITRAKVTVRYPARFLLCAAMNPPGVRLGEDGPFLARLSDVKRVWGKISGPILDRIDIQVEVPRLSREELMSLPEGEASRKIRERVEAALSVQRDRNPGGKPNGHLISKELDSVAKLKPGAKGILEKAVDALKLSARAYYKVVAVARTIADLEGSADIKREHVMEAVSYRPFDRGF